MMLSSSPPAQSGHRRSPGFCARIVPLLLLAAGNLVAQPVGKTEAIPGIGHNAARQALAGLSRDLNAIIADRSFADASWGVSVISCDNGESLFSFNDRKNRQIASNIKLLTTAAALQNLGGSYRYATELYAGGEPGANGELNGDLVIRTSGDPSLSPSFGIDPREMIRGWAHTLDSLGIRSVGNIVVDASYFDDVPYAPGWAWDDESYGFNAQISAAAIYDNSVQVTVTPGKEPNAPVQIDISPSTAYVTLKVMATTSRSDSTSTIDVRRERGEKTIVVHGNIAAGSDPYVEHISVEKPTLFFATIVREELERNGIVIHGSAYDAAEYRERFSYNSLRKIAEHLSPPLREIVAATNKQSLNLSAEMLAKKLGRDFGGTGTTAAGVEVVKRLLTIAGVDIEHVRLYDGSGLSRQDMLAPADVTSLLRWAQRSHIAGDYLASLAIAGRDGTLTNRLRGTLAENNAIGKTGFLSGIRALSGYVRTRDGELLSFSIVANNYSVPTGVVNTAQDLMVMRLASFSRKN